MTRDWFDDIVDGEVVDEDPVLDDEGEVLVPDRPHEAGTPEGYTLDAYKGMWFHNDSGVYVRDPAVHARWLIDLDRRLRD